MKRKQSNVLSREKTFNSSGEEIPDPRPAEVPLGFRVPKSWSDNIAQIVRRALNEKAENEGLETFEEANDFNCPEEDEELELTPYEEHFDHEENFMADVASKAINKVVKKEADSEVKESEPERAEPVAKVNDKAQSTT